MVYQNIPNPALAELEESQTADSEVSGLIPGLDTYLLVSSLPMLEISIIKNCELQTFY